MIGELFTRHAVTVEAETSVVDEHLYPEERAYIRTAGVKRRAEFGTARVCARQALVAIGVPPVALVPGPDRAPRWPPGVTGSITHTDGYCAVVVHRSPPFRSVGIDAETLRPLNEATVNLILTSRERRWLAMQAEARRAELALLTFSAKEAYYKCQYSLTGVVLDFHDVEIDVDQGTHSFQAIAHARDLPRGARHLGGRFAFAAGRVICGVELPILPS